MRFAVAVLMLIGWSGGIFGQNPKVLSAGYSAPAAQPVAPGQILTLFLQSVAGQPEQPIVARELPLPTNLLGYSVNLEQTFSSSPVAVPLLAVYPDENCVGPQPVACQYLAAITVQIPWDLIPNVPGAGRPQNAAILRVSLNGVPGEAYPLNPVTDSVHVIDTCDATFPGGAERPVQLTGPCRPLVTHGDGRMVSPEHPAQVGEVLIAYAFGLGTATGVPRTGDGVREPIPLTDVSIHFEYGANQSAVRPVVRDLPGQAPSPLPVYAGLVAGQVGLYQIAFTVPVKPENAPQCTASAVLSNFTVSIGRRNSFSGAGICVE